MSGFGTNPAGSSAFSFPSLNQQNTTVPGAAPTFSFGATKTTASAIPLGSSPAFGVSPSLGVKSSISMTATSTPSGIPTLGGQQPGTLFGTTWSGGMFSAGSNADAVVTSAATLSSLAPTAATTSIKTGQFSFGTSTPTALPQSQALMGTQAGTITTSAPGFSVPAPQLTQQLAPQLTSQQAPQLTSQLAPQLSTQMAPQLTQQMAPQLTQQMAPQLTQQLAPQLTQQLAPQLMQQMGPQLTPAATQAAVTSSAPTLNFSFGGGPNTTVAPPSLGMTVPSFGVAPLSKPQAAATPTVATTFTASTPLASTTLKFSVAPLSTPASTAPLTSVAKAPATMGMTLFTGPATNVPPPNISAVTATVPAVSAVASVTSTLAQPAVTSISGSGIPTTTVTTAAPTAAVAAPTEEDVMTYSKLQENINKWAMELEKQEKLFLHQATEMNGWDRVIVENSDKLHMLNSKIEKVRKEQRHLDLELDYILSQQNELDYMLKGLEKEWGSVPPSDPERQHTYKIAESLDYKLKLMSEDLKEVVDHMNAMNYPPNDEFNPVMQIVRILNAHMNVLLMVERKTNLAECKVKEVGKLLELCKRDYDRACHLYFD